APLLGVVEATTGRHAMHVGGYRWRGQLEHLVPGRCRRCRVLAVKAQPPLRHVIARRAAVREHRPLLRQDLAGRQAMRVLDDPGIRLAVASKDHQPPPWASPEGEEPSSGGEGRFSSFRNWSKAST